MSDLVSAIDRISKLPPLSADAQRTLAAWRLETAAGLRAVSRAPLSLHASLSDDTFSAIFAFLEAEPGAAWRLLLANKGCLELVAPSKRKDVLWRAFGPLANKVRDRLAVDARAFSHFPRASMRVPYNCPVPRRPLMNGEFKPFGEVTIGGETCRFGESVRRGCSFYGELAPVSLMLPHHADDKSPWGDDLGGLLVFFGPLHPGPAGELPAFAAKGSDGRPLTWGDLFEMDEEEPIPDLL